MATNYDVQITDFIFSLRHQFHLTLLFYIGRKLGLPITVATHPSPCSLLPSNAGVMRLNPIVSIDICKALFYLMEVESLQRADDYNTHSGKGEGFESYRTVVLHTGRIDLSL
jgi:hypothetical protein